jgi:F0F1-type ATP synthase membrane subunit b/b'
VFGKYKCLVPLTQPAPDCPQGHAKAADAGGKVAEQAEAARLSAEAHVADAKAGAEQFANESREKAEKAMNDAKEKTEQALNEAKQKTEQAMNEAKEKAEAMANEAKQKAEAFANEAKEKAEAFANEAKEKAAEIWCGRPCLHVDIRCALLIMHWHAGPPWLRAPRGSRARSRR